MIRDYFNEKELNKSINLDEAVANGAAIQAAILTGDGYDELKDMLINDVITHSIGIESDGGVM